jgi:proteasome accessory factor C
VSRFTASERLTRLLAVIPHVAGRGYVPLDEIVERFGYPRADLVADLTEVLPYVGVAPFTPDTLIEVSVDEGNVRIDYADWFAKPLRLAPGEALALLAAGRALAAAEPGEEAGPLVRGLTKLGAALGAGGDGALEVHLGVVAEETLALLRAAVREQRQVQLDYYSYGRDQRSTRIVEPRRFYADEGNWYIAGYCHLATADRVFRVDRIRQATLLETTFTVAERDDGVLGTFAATDEHPRVVLELEPDARWVVDQYPHDELVELDGGRVRVTLAVTAQAWLERLLVRLGPAAVVVDAPRGLGDDARSAAARRILGRYTASGTASS